MRNRITWDSNDSDQFLDVDVKINLTLEVIILLVRIITWYTHSSLHENSWLQQVHSTQHMLFVSQWFLPVFVSSSTWAQYFYLFLFFHQRVQVRCSAGHLHMECYGTSLTPLKSRAFMISTDSLMEVVQFWAIAKNYPFRGELIVDGMGLLTKFSAYMTFFSNSSIDIIRQCLRSKKSMCNLLCNLHISY